MPIINDNGIDRTMTDDEKARYEADSITLLAEAAARNDRVAAYEAAAESGRAKLAALGLTEAEIKALVG